ncbi:Hypothetical predicted protein, partial [Pelobates cultripes]
EKQFRWITQSIGDALSSQHSRERRHAFPELEGHDREIHENLQILIWLWQFHGLAGQHQSFLGVEEVHSDDISGCRSL